MFVKENPDRKKKIIIIIIIIIVVNNMIDLVDDEPNEKRVVKRGRDANWKKDRDEKEAYSNIVLDFCRLRRLLPLHAYEL